MNVWFWPTLDMRARAPAAVEDVFKGSCHSTLCDWAQFSVWMGIVL